MTTTTERIGLAERLVRLTHLVQQVFAEASREQDLTPQQTQLLCLLIGGPVGMAELGRTLHLEKSSLTGLVDRVERRGLVARARDTRDRRACRIELTAEGRRVGELAHDGVTDRLTALLADLRPADRDQLTAILTRLVPA